MEFKNISKTFDGKKVLDDFSLEVKKGEPVCIFGPSGLGKTTLLNIAAGLIKPDSGEMRGNDGTVSYVFQEDRLLDWFTAEENIKLVSAKGNMAEEFIEISGIKDCLKKYPPQLSGGERKRVAVARAVAHNGDIILLDEPFNGIDEKRAEMIAEFLKKFVSDKICILVTHNTNEAKWLGAKIVSFIDNNY